jgi:hypothetical protein
MKPFALVLACLASLACRSLPPAPEVPYPAPDPAKRQEMAALAFLSYIGEWLKGSDDEVERQLAPCLAGELAKQPLTAGKWTLAWGPAVYKFALGELDDNMLYVVAETADPSHLAVVTRGTNAKAILDWLIEDFEVRDQVDWRYGDPPGSLHPKIARGVEDALTVLQRMVPASGVPGAGQTLAQFLAAQSAKYPALRVDVAGHSLGGTLATTLALWLADTRAGWDPAGQAQLAVYSLAGFTAGDADFAAYSDSRIGAATDRIHNPLDVAPLVWSYGTMGTMADLYEPLARADFAERAAIDGARDLVKDKGYTQIRPAAPPLPAALEDSKPSFADQGGWQHTCGYRCALGLVGETFLPVTLDCQTTPPPPCPVCPTLSP